MNWTLWWLFVPTEALLCLAPGPAVLLVLATALRAGGRRSIASSLGILAANAVYFLISASSLGALLIASYRLFFLIKWIGAVYLVVLGIRTMLGAREPLIPAAELSAKAESFGRRFANGFLLQMSNPKALIFFTALLPQFIDTRFPVAWQVAILGVTSELIEFCVLLGYGLAAGRAAQLARQPRYAAWTNRLSGGMLIGAGAGLAMIRRGP